MINKTLVYLLFIFAIFVFTAWLFTDIFIYLSVSIVLATILRPLTNFLSRAYIFKVKISRVLAILVSYSVVVGVVILFALLFIPLIIDQVNVLTQLSFDEVYTTLSQPVVAVEDFMIEYKLVSEEEHSLTSTIRSNVFSFVSNIDFRNIINNLLTFTGGFFITVMAIGFITFFLLYDNGLLSRILISIVPNQYFELFISAIHKIEHLLSNYLIGLLLQMMAIFSIAALGLSILSVKYALTIAVFAALANLIPYLGPMLGAMFGIVIGLSSNGNFALDQFSAVVVLKIVSVFAVVQAIDNVLLQPLIFSKSVKAHPLEIFVVIFAAATLAGIPGMIAAIPVYTILRVSVVEIESGFKSYRIFKLSK